MDTSNKPLQLASKLLKGIGGSTTRALACISLPNPVDTDCEIRDYRVLGSYNLLDTQTPTILIPGLPRVWQEPSLPLQLSPDHGYAFIDQNAWRCHESPLEPIFRSILVTQKLLGNNSFSLSGEQIDIVTDRNNMRKLNAMIRSMRSQEALAPNKNREFRIDARLAPNGRTLLLTRYSDQLRQMINPSDGSYGANFERATTIKRAPILISNNGKSGENEVSPCSYHRIAKYRLADLNLLVRYEVDAVQDDSPVDGLPTLEQQSLEQKTIETQNNSTLCHIVSGTLVSQDRVMELKSGKLKWTQIFPQLYFSQTPLLKTKVTMAEP
ncbi:unnamed protein product [Rhizoctonia solani]|uniref:Uncharacterized protein n=1 Tax=Rhizoctonia solani TaxID=456999 RepID=A0A8H3BLY9_9AGAM|nr:unnamed protein product [Rhizoctonia solani]